MKKYYLRSSSLDEYNRKVAHYALYKKSFLACKDLLAELINLPHDNLEPAIMEEK